MSRIHCKTPIDFLTCLYAINIKRALALDVGTGAIFQAFLCVCRLILLTMVEAAK